jgi:23S rRNA (adenine2503-C2)-methyltransferase
MGCGCFISLLSLHLLTTNCTVCNQGKPLNNYSNVVAALERMHSDLGLGWRHITISTVGIAPRIRKIADEYPQVRCACAIIFG